MIQTVEQFVPVRLNAEKGGASEAKQFAVSGYPTIVFVDSSGRKVDTIVGFEPAPQFTADLHRILLVHGPLPGLEKQYRAHPTADEGIVLAKDYLQAGEPERAKPILTSLSGSSPMAELAPVYLSMGDLYFSKQDAEPAIGAYRKALRAGVSGSGAEQGRFNLSLCYLEEGKMAAGTYQLRVLLRRPDLSPALRRDAQRALRIAQERARVTSQP
ncbi:MAG TPA: hypothetical protein VFJ58_11135 [Armatimonadota bacterium]|nr:hypothetical protein [Armatimonadota bacterium]